MKIEQEETFLVDVNAKLKYLTVIKIENVKLTSVYIC